MAVQAQYPSNVLLLNRTIQEGKNQPGLVSGGDGGGGGGGIALFDQPHIFFNSGVTTNNSRKRGRETMGTTTLDGSNALISVTLQQQQQQQQSQMIDLTQLHTPQNNPNNVVVSTGLRLAFGDQQQQQQQQQQRHLQQQRQQQQYYNSHQQQQTSLSPQSSVSLSILSDDFASQIKQQRDEIHHFIQVQGEQLRRELSQKRQRQYRELLVAAEEAVARRLREKEVEVEKAVRRNAELEARAAQLSAEAQVWQARARAQEATAATLQAQLQQAMMGGGGGGGCNANRDDQWGNGNGVDGVVAEDAESAYIDPDRVSVLTGPSCKACRKRVASAVLLPCRHLCLCTECDAVAQACPLCFTFRSSSVEVNLC